MASQMNASVIEGAPRQIGLPGYHRLGRPANAPANAKAARGPCSGTGASLELAGQPTGDGVLGVAAERPLEGGERADAQAEQGQLALQFNPRCDVKQAKPAAQARAEPAGQPLLPAEIDDVQFAARPQPGERAGQHR